MKDNFDKWYKVEFEKLSENPSDELWDNIASRLDKNDKKRRRKYILFSTYLLGVLITGTVFLFSNKQEYTIADGNTEEKITREITVNNTNPEKNKLNNLNENQKGNTAWKNRDDNSITNAEESKYLSLRKKDIAISEDKRENKNSKNERSLKIYPSRSSYIFKPSLIARKSENKTSIVSAMDPEVTESSTAILDSSRTASDNFIALATIEENRVRKSDISVEEKNINKENSVEEIPKTVKEENGKLDLNNQSELLSSADTIMEESEDSSSNKEKNKKKESSLKKDRSNIGSFFVGVTGSYNNVWLLNHDTYNGLSSSELDQTLLTFGEGYGVSVGYNLTERWDIQTDILVNNRHGEKYQYYLEGKSFSKDVLLNYAQLNLFIKRKSPRSINSSMEGSVNKLAGLHIGYLKSAKEKTSYDETNIRARYNTLNYGIVAGMEYELTINEKWMLSSGLMSNIGLRNIYKGTAKEPGHFNKTYTFSLGINFGVRYILGK